MRSLPRVIKAGTVYIDQDSTVQIKTEAIKPILPPPEIVEAEEEAVDLTEARQAQAATDVLKSADEEAAAVLRRADMELQAIIAKAQNEADTLKADAEARIEEEARRIREEAHQEAYQKGMDEARAEGNAIRAEAERIRAEAIREQTETRLALEPEAVRLIVNIVEKLVGSAVEINPALVVSLIRKGFAGATLSGQVVVRVSDNDYKHVMDHQEEILALTGGMAQVEIVRDPSLGLTDCVIDTPFGGIDVSLTPQLEALRENLIFLLEHP